MKIVITGSSGFIGFHTCIKFLEEGYEVYGIDNENNYYDVNLKQSRRKIIQKNTKKTLSFINMIFPLKIKLLNCLRTLILI